MYWDKIIDNDRTERCKKVHYSLKENKIGKDSIMSPNDSVEGYDAKSFLTPLPEEVYTMS
jgi:hypothetical protein